MSDVTIFAPSPTLTVTIEGDASGADIHVHAGGQGVWQARMLRRLGVSVTMCSALTGEIGVVLRHLLEDEGLSVAAVEREGRGSAYVHDRRDGARSAVAETEGDPVGRHDLDELYGVVLREGLESGLVLLSGPAGEDALPADMYRRLASDLREAGARVVVDLAGSRLTAALEGGVDVLKVSHTELIDDGLAADESPHELMTAMRMLCDRGAATVIVTRADDPLLLLDASGFVEVTPPRLEETDSRGAGDSLTAGIAAALARGEEVRSAVTMGAAAGALNVTRHGLGTGDADAIAQLREAVATRELPDETVAEVDQPAMGHVSPDGLAALAEPADEPVGPDSPGEETDR